MDDGSRTALRIGITVDPPDWHSEALTAAMAAEGVHAVPFKLAAAGFDTTSPSGLRIPGFGGALPDAVIARAISGGTFEAVTMRLGVLHALREMGVPVWNDARTIERCVDKSTTSFLMARAGVPTPPTWTTESAEEARAIVQREATHGPLVFKPLFGAQGRGLRLIAAADDLPEPAEAHGVYYLQRFVGVEREGFRDTRVLVSRGRVVAAMLRQSPTWITNIKQGGRPLPVVLDTRETELALRCAALVEAAFVGVDIVHDGEDRPWVIEVNSMPAWRGLQEVTPFPIAAALVRDLLGSVGDRRDRSGTPPASRATDKEFEQHQLGDNQPGISAKRGHRAPVDPSRLQPRTCR